MDLGWKEDGAYSFANLLHCTIGKRLPSLVFTQENSFRDTFVESCAGMFPVSNMVSEAEAEDAVSKVVAVVEEPECVNNAITSVCYYQECWCGTSSSCASIPYDIV